LVEEGGFTYNSDAYNDEVLYWVTIDEHDHLVVPYSLTNNDVKAVRGGISTGREFFDFLHDGSDLLCREGKTAPKMMTVRLNSRIIGHPARGSALERFLDHVASEDNVWICRRDEVAQHWYTHHRPAAMP
jgi:allantoinase